MNIVVTKNNIDYLNSFLKVSSLKEVVEVVGTIDVLVYNNSTDAKEDRLEYLGLLKDKAKKLVYICNERQTDLAVKMMVIGSEGKYFDDEFFLESPFELSNLINSLEEVTALASLGGVNVLGDFFNRYLKNGSSDFNSNYLMVVKDALNTVLSEYNQKNLEIIQMSETATDIFSNASMLLSKMKEEKESMQEVVEKMTSKLKDSPKKPVASKVLFYPRVNYLNERSIIRIKELGSVSFLVSFMLGFKLYLENVKHVRPKLIFFEPVGDLIERKYENFNWVTLNNFRDISNYYSDVIFTNCPSKEVIDKLLNDDNYDTFIVVDRTISDKDHILNSKGGVVKYAISGKSTMNKFGLSNKVCISSVVDIPGVLLTIPLFPEYPASKSQRETLYATQMASEYQKLLSDLRGW